MKITSICIKNYKSIRDLEFSPSPRLNVLIGENNAGKSNILEAINLLLGPTFPTFNSISRQDHYQGNEENRIYIKLSFDTGECLQFTEFLDDSRKQKPGLYYSSTSQAEKLCSSKEREKFCCAYVGVERQISDFLPSNRWNLLGRILLDINEKFTQEKTEDGNLKMEVLKKKLDDIRDGILFTVKDENGNEIMKNFIETLRNETANQINVNKEDIEINFNLYNPWNFFRSLQILVKEKGCDLEFQPSQLGMGTQASMTIAILRAYSDIKLGGSNPIFIDEAELFLHPKAQRNLYSILRKLSEKDTKDQSDEGVQIFYTTHSPYMLSLEYFDEIILVKKENNSTVIKKADKNNPLGEAKGNREQTLTKKLRNLFEQTGNSLFSLEAFFGRKIILVEGESEAVLLPLFFGRIDFDYNEQGITIVNCGGKQNIIYFYKVYSEFDLPCFVIFDGDLGAEKTDKDLKTASDENASLFKLLGKEPTSSPDNKVHQNYLCFEENLEKNLANCGFKYVDGKKGSELYNIVAYEMNHNGVQVPYWVNELKDALEQLQP